MDIRGCLCNKTDYKEFKQVVDLKNSGLLLFLHNEKTKHCRSRNCNNSIILHNTGEKDLRRFDYIAELCQYRTKCNKCKRLIQYARTLLDDLNTIRKNEVLGVCAICKKSHRIKKCPRCEFIVEKYINRKIENIESRQKFISTWLLKVRDFLLSLTTDPSTLYNFHFRKECLLELKDTLETLSIFLSEQNRNVLTYLDADKIKLLEKENIKILEDLLIKLQSSNVDMNSELENRFESLLGDLDAVNKYFISENDKICEENQVGKNENSLNVVPNNKPKIEKIVLTDTKKNMHLKNISEKSYKRNKLKIKKDIIQKGKGLATSSLKISQNKKAPETSPSAVESDLLIMMKMMKKDKRPLDIKIDRYQNAPFNDFEESTKNDSVSEITVLEKETIIDQEMSESILECNQHKNISPRVKIKDIKIVPYGHHYNNTFDTSLKPLLFKAKYFVDSERDDATSNDFDDEKNPKTTDNKDRSGVITYKLSDPEFIDMGWTVLPYSKILRKINIYKMAPAHPNWFEIQKKESSFYNTGEKLAVVHDSGGGIWFYKNGNTALHCYNAEELNIGRRYVIYSSGELDEAGKKKAITVLACFDSLGNGVVYDHSGNIRLKYNQSEGIVIDNKIGPAGRWKWHTLNEPPVLEEVFIDTYDKDFISDDDKKKTTSKSTLNVGRPTQEEKQIEVLDEMIAIEFANVLKEKAKEMSKIFKPVQVKMKVLKINNYFSLRIIDQTKIYITFRCGNSHLKLDLGMNLISNIIIDTCAAEVSDVATPYDSITPKSKSVLDLQNIISNTRNRYKLKGVAKLLN